MFCAASRIIHRQTCYIKFAKTCFHPNKIEMRLATVFSRQLHTVTTVHHPFHTSSGRRLDDSGRFLVGSNLVQHCTLYGNAMHIANTRSRTCMGKMRENLVRCSYNQIKSAIREIITLYNISLMLCPRNSGTVFSSKGYVPENRHLANISV